MGASAIGSAFAAGFLPGFFGAAVSSAFAALDSAASAFTASSASALVEELKKIAGDVWKYDLKQKEGDLTSIELYVKPEENKVYYVMNKEFTGSFDI